MIEKNQKIKNEDEKRQDQEYEKDNDDKTPIVLNINDTGKKTMVIKWLIPIVSIIVLFSIIIGIILTINHKNNEPDKKRRTEITSIGMVVKETISISSLKTAEYTFNGVAKWIETDEKGKTDRIAYVSYSGLVRYGIDFSKIRIEEEDNLIVIRIPALEKKLTVDPNQMKCIFTDLANKKKYDNASTYRQTILKVCEDHLKFNEEKSDNISHVKKYTEDYIVQITKPLLDQQDYEVKILWEDNNK